MNKIPNVKMSRKQAVFLWNNMSLEEKKEFNILLKKLYGKELVITKVNVDDNEQIQNIVLEHKDKPSLPTAPYAKHFNTYKNEK